MTDIAEICPKDEKTWLTYYNKNEELLFFLTSPEGTSSTIAAQTGAFTLYAVTYSGKGKTGSAKIKKLGQSGNPKELEEKYHVVEAMSE
ncbi:MAG: hypothetical protein IJH70_07150 [Oscillospiraceae bacterium]|nr:hypothetical protein [Oscillospiraceae bacterium]